MRKHVFNFGICDESENGRFNKLLARQLSHRQLCAAFAAQGWDYIETAPAGAEKHLIEMTRAERRQRRKEAEDANIPYRKGHWLASFTKHKTTSRDPAVRCEATEFFCQVAEGLGDLGVDGAIYGSPPSRNVEGEEVTNEHYDLFADTMRGAMRAFDEHGIDFFFEYLPKKETNFGNTPDDARKVVRKINHPRASKFHFDCKASGPLVANEQQMADLIRSLKGEVGSGHLQDIFGGFPGRGSIDCQPGTGEETDFRPILRALMDIGLTTVSVEMFCFLEGFPGYPMPDPLEYLAQCIRYLRNCEAEILAA